MTFLFVFAVMAFAADVSDRPESAIPTPAEEVRNSDNMRELATKEKEDWQKMRAERKQARERILMEMRNKSADEKRAMREEMGKNRDKNPRFEGAPPKKFEEEPPRDWGRKNDPSMERPKSYNPNPMPDRRGPGPNEDHIRR